MKKSLILVASLIAFAVPLTAQTPPPSPPPEAILKTALGLTDAQLAGLRALEEARATAIASIQPQLQSAQGQLAAALTSPAPDAAAVGQLVLAINGLQQHVAQIQQTTRESFAAVLTDDQRSQLAAFAATRIAIVAASALEALGL